MACDASVLLRKERSGLGCRFRPIPPAPAGRPFNAPSARRHRFCEPATRRRQGEGARHYRRALFFRGRIVQSLFPARDKLSRSGCASRGIASGRRAVKASQRLLSIAILGPPARRSCSFGRRPGTKSGKTRLRAPLHAAPAWGFITHPHTSARTTGHRPSLCQPVRIQTSVRGRDNHKGGSKALHKFRGTNCPCD